MSHLPTEFSAQIELPASKRLHSQLSPAQTAFSQSLQPDDLSDIQLPRPAEKAANLQASKIVQAFQKEISVIKADHARVFELLRQQQQLLLQILHAVTTHLGKVDPAAADGFASQIP
jgi:hypothetical protein